MPGDNLLLTGVPGVGKTTALKKVAVSLGDRKIRGFLTGEIRERGRRVGFEIRAFDGQVLPVASPVSLAPFFAAPLCLCRG